MYSLCVHFVTRLGTSMRAGATKWNVSSTDGGRWGIFKRESEIYLQATELSEKL
jgi:hypothetical protein